MTPQTAFITRLVLFGTAALGTLAAGLADLLTDGKYTVIFMGLAILAYVIGADLWDEAANATRADRVCPSCRPPSSEQSDAPPVGSPPA